MSQNDSMSISNPDSDGMDWIEKSGLALSSIGLLILLVAWSGYTFEQNALYLTISLASIASGIVIYSARLYSKTPPGIKNNRVFLNSLTNKGLWGWVSGIVLTGFYIILYGFSDLLGVNPNGNTGLVGLFDPLSMFFKGKPANQWFVYGTLYTLLILFLGIKFIIKYRHNRYHLIRTIVVIISQLFLAYLIPEILEGLNPEQGYFTKDLKQIWPLNYYITEDWYLNNMQQAQSVGPSGIFYLFWGLILFLVVTPVLTYYVGKRWYCSWVCGCGGLAETAGDPFRQLSSKSLTSWKVERWLVHSVMVFVLIMSVGVFYSYFSRKEFDIVLFTINQHSYFVTAAIFLAITLAILLFAYFKWSNRNKYLLIGAGIITFIFIALAIAYFGGGKEVFLVKSASMKKWYGFGVGAVFSGVIGVGFYPILGNRVWCRFGCPMAGYMGIIQRFKSRFRITTNGGQCISCGNCSTYCEQGIDVRAYAQKGQNIVRASCVGCGVCSAVCPRGVLKLENGPEEKRIQEDPTLLGNDSFNLTDYTKQN